MDTPSQDVVESKASLDNNASKTTNPSQEDTRHVEGISKSSSNKLAEEAMVAETMGTKLALKALE